MREGEIGESRFSIGFRRHLAGLGDYDRSVPRSRDYWFIRGGEQWRYGAWLPSIIDQVWWEWLREIGTVVNVHKHGSWDSRECS